MHFTADAWYSQKSFTVMNCFTKVWFLFYDTSLDVPIDDTMLDEMEE
jgi:hypothetical protein